MNDKLAEKRRKLDEAQARKLAGLDPADNSELGSPEDLPPDAVVTKHGDVIVNGQEVDPNETNAMGEKAINNPEGNTSDVNRDTDTDGDADGNPDTFGHQGIDKGIEPQTTDPRVNQSGGNPLYAEGNMKTYDPSTYPQTLPAGTPTHTVLAPTQGDGQVEGSSNAPGDTAETAKASVQENVLSPRISERTLAEMSRGRDAVSQKEQDAARARETSDNRAARETVVTDAKSDPDGDKGRKAAEDKASKKSDTKSKK